MFYKYITAFFKPGVAKYHPVEKYFSNRLGKTIFDKRDSRNIVIIYEIEHNNLSDPIFTTQFNKPSSPVSPNYS